MSAVQMRSSSRAETVWVNLCHAMTLYHDYSVTGLDRLTGPDARASLIVGYHGRPIAWDIMMLGLRIREHLGYLPGGFIHSAAGWIPGIKQLTEGAHMFREDSAEVGAWVREGRHLMVTPGGGREAGRSWRERYTVRWGDRIGFVKLAVKHGLRIVPVGSSGIDEPYIGLNDSSRLGRRLGLPKSIEPLPWLAIGIGGFFPLALPFPAQMRQHIGQPIDPRAAPYHLDPEQLAAYERERRTSGHRAALGPDASRFERTCTELSHRVQADVQALLDEARLPETGRGGGDGS